MNNGDNITLSQTFGGVRATVLFIGDLENDCVDYSANDDDGHILVTSDNLMHVPPGRIFKSCIEYDWGPRQLCEIVRNLPNGTKLFWVKDSDIDRQSISVTVPIKEENDRGGFRWL